MMQSPDKAIRRATMVAKGLAKEIGPLPTGYHPKPPHPASMIPGVHVTGMGDEHTAIPDGYADGGDVTSNPHFSQWFGNSVTHDNGVPRTYYTGTSKDKDFTSFNVGRHGAWFTTDPHEASQYAENNDSQGHVWENGRPKWINTASRVIPAYLKAENPYTGERPEATSRAQNYKKAQSDWFDQLRAAGHDAWIPSSLKGNLAVMLRHPTQIKSAIGNNGDFDPKQKAIHRADGGPTPAWQRKEGQTPSGGLNSKARAIHKDGGAVDDLARRLTTHRNVLSGMDHKAQYAAIDGIMRDVSKHHNIMPNKLHDGWVARHRQTPDDWINSNVRGLATGGNVTQTGNSKMPNDAVDHALRIVNGHYSNGGVPVNYRTLFAPQQAPQMTDQTGFTEHAGPVSIGSLSAAFDKAIAHHLSLPPEERIANRKRADAALAPHVGMKKDGKVVPLLGKNAKMMKAETGYKGGEPALLPDGRGIETTGLALAPSYQEGQFNTCPNSQSCKAECIGKTAGFYFKVGGGSDLSAFEGPRLNSLKKTLAMMRQPEAFAVRLHDEIAAAKREAEANGNLLGVRLNVLSDINPRVHKSIIEAHPDVAFYDYTKNNSNPIAPNHHYTYSSTGLTQPEGVNGNPKAAVNRFQNWKQMRKRLDGGDNVAMSFSHRRHVPETVHDEETGKIYRVVNGDTHDFRPIDMQPPGADGVIIGLKNKKTTGTMEDAAHDSNGFFVHYDPQEAKTTQGTLVRGPSPELNPETNKPIAGPTVALNKSVIIPNQTAPKPIINNDSKPEQGQ